LFKIKSEPNERRGFLDRLSIPEWLFECDAAERRQSSVPLRLQADWMFDLGPYLGLGPVFCPLTLVHHAKVAVARLMKSWAFGACCLITARWPRYA
jgi:hypothetical protein